MLLLVVKQKGLGCKTWLKQNIEYIFTLSIRFLLSIILYVVS